MMRQEVVDRRHWVTDHEFLDLLGATNLIPGPNSTEMAIHLGYRRGGWRGLLVGGISFIAPAALVVLAVAWAYVRYGSTPQASSVLYGVRPVLIAVILQALWTLGKVALKGPLLGAVGIASLILFMIGVNAIALLVASGVLVMAVANHRLVRESRWSLHHLIPVLQPQYLAWLAGLPPVAVAAPFSLLRLFGLMLKIGSVLYGSGYVLLAFLRADFVERLQWLTDRQLLDAMAIGQATPGPVLTTATFIGYLLGGIPGAAVATAGIFLPGFVFVAASQPVLPKLRRSPWASAFLDGVNAASLAFMAGVTWQLGHQAVVDSVTAGLALAAVGLLVHFQVNSFWLILGGAIVGLIVR